MGWSKNCRSDKILVVDNDLDHLKNVEKIFTHHHHYQVDTINSSEEALNKIYSMSLDWHPQYYDLLLLELEMPVMKGNILAKIIRQTEESMRDTPIIGMSKDIQHYNSTFLVKYGLTDYTKKPITSVTAAQILGF